MAEGNEARKSEERGRVGVDESGVRRVGDDAGEAAAPSGATEAAAPSHSEDAQIAEEIDSLEEVEAVPVLQPRRASPPPPPGREDRIDLEGILRARARVVVLPPDARPSEVPNAAPSLAPVTIPPAREPKLGTLLGIGLFVGCVIGVAGVVLGMQLRSHDAAGASGRKLASPDVVPVPAEQAEPSAPRGAPIPDISSEEAIVTSTSEELASSATSAPDVAPQPADVGPAATAEPVVAPPPPVAPPRAVVSAQPVEPATAPAPSPRRAPAAATEPAIDPSLPEAPSREQVAASFEAIASTVRSCTAQPLGMVPVRITVASSGRVTTALVTGRLAGTPEGSCIARAVRTARLPAFRQERLVIDYPFQL